MEHQKDSSPIPLDVFAYPVDVFTDPRILSGYVHCPPGLRLLDFLNDMVEESDAHGGFVEIIDESTSDAINNQVHLQTFVRKTAIELVSITDADLARGAGAKEVKNPKEYVQKSPVKVWLQLPTYSIISKMHYAQGQLIRDVLNEKTLFLPLTDVTIAHQDRLFATRPFVAVNKNMIISLKEETY